IEGKRDHLVGKLQERYGENKQTAEREIDMWMSTP
ncbi:MAG: CsbD family protein, partial [Alphaproteobacteria bacterium]